MTCHGNEEEDSSFLCRDCSFQAMNRDQLLEHIEIKHGKLICNSCNIACNNRNELNKHIKERHTSHKPCREYATNSCQYQSDCNYKHIKLKENEHICYTCGVIVPTIKDLMIHIKEIHGSQPCTKFARGKCDRNSRCWYSHNKLPAINNSMDTSYSREQDFCQVPTTPRQYSSVVGTRMASKMQVHQVSENVQNKNIIRVTQEILTQLMPTLIKDIIKSMNLQHQ